MPRRVPAFSRGVSSAGVSIAVLPNLGSIGLVGGFTAGLFFGSGFLLLGQPIEQIHAGSRVHDRNTEVSPLRPAASSVNVESETPFGGDSVLSSTANGAALIAPPQTAGLDEAGPSWKATLTPPPLDGGSDQFRKIASFEFEV